MASLSRRRFLVLLPVLGPALAGTQHASEEILLGRMILEGHPTRTRAEDFADPTNREVYRAAADVMKQRQPLDLVSLVDRLKRRGTLQVVGGPARLLALVHAAYQ